MKFLIIFITLLCFVPGFRLQHYFGQWNNGNWMNTYKEGSACYTPDYVSGTCTKLNICTNVYNRFTHLIYLTGSHRGCGEEYADEWPLVCCSPNQKPFVNETAVLLAEKCINSKSEIGKCIPLITCKSLHAHQSIPIINETCVEGSNLICCTSLQSIFYDEIEPYPSDDYVNDSDSVKLLTVDEGCGETFIKKRVKRIIGGEPSKMGNWPWIALLGYNDGMKIEFKCGGVLITKKHVLTAAHCITSHFEFVRLGEHDLSTDEEADHVDVKVSEIYPHPQYNRVDSVYDIAVLYLYETVNFTTFIAPICLPITSKLQSLSYENTQPFVTGWGKTVERGSGATILQNIQIQVYDNLVCKNLYKKQNAVISDKQFSEVVLCAGDLNNGKDSCDGDSGGPIMLPTPHGDGERYVLIGLVSYGIGCGRKDVPSVNTNVMNLIDWIKERVVEMS